MSGSKLSPGIFVKPLVYLILVNRQIGKDKGRQRIHL